MSEAYLGLECGCVCIQRGLAAFREDTPSFLEGLGLRRQLRGVSPVDAANELAKVGWLLPFALTCTDEMLASILFILFHPLLPARWNIRTATFLCTVADAIHAAAP